jgi:putative hydrolase of the HAD superfamily
MPQNLLLLDLDNTLWDFDGNAEEALAELFHRHQLHLKSNAGVQQFIETYKVINKHYWQLYENGAVSKDILRSARFTDTFLQLGIPVNEHPENIWDEYLEICPVMTRMMPGAQLFLEEITQFFDLFLVTNGFEKTQQTKIKHSGIHRYIKGMITSESAGIAKPDAGIFEKAIGEYASNYGHPPKIFYAGDTWESDVKGGIEAGIETLWYNHTNAVIPEDEYAQNVLFCGSFTTLSAISGWLGKQVLP